MTLTVSLEPEKEAKLLEIARQKGVSADALVREAIDRMLATLPGQPVKPRTSAYGLLEKYGPGPTEADIEENRREMFRRFGADLIRKYLAEAIYRTPEEVIDGLLESLSEERPADEENTSILELEGLGKAIWQGIDAQEYVDRERSSWNG